MKILVQISLAAERLDRFFAAKYCPFSIKTVQIFIGIITIAISAAVHPLGRQLEMFGVSY